MTTREDRVDRVMRLGFTERQATFLVTVVRHSGWCVERQYCVSAQYVHGATTRNFFRDLVSHKFATAYPTAKNGAHIYHVHHKALYAAIGEPHNRNRKPSSVGRVVEGLIVLDTVLGARHVTWLATEREKVAHFTQTTPLRPDELPHLTFGTGTRRTVRHFPDKLPIGIHPDRRTHEFVYVVNRQVPVDFRPFLYRHAMLLRVIPAWILRLLVPRHLEEAAPSFSRACHEELGVRLSPSTLEELRWYFRERRALSTNAVHAVDHQRYRRARRAFGAPRYQVLYRHWLQMGDRLIYALDSPVLPEALAQGTGQVESHVITRRYHHLAPLVGTA